MLLGEDTTNWDYETPSYLLKYKALPGYAGPSTLLQSLFISIATQGNEEADRQNDNDAEWFFISPKPFFIE